MTNIFVIAGHGAGDPGACANGYSEAECVRRLASEIKRVGGDAVTLGDFSRNYYADNGISYLNIPMSTQIIELHMNSFSNENAKGGHVIINPNFEPDDYDLALADFISSFFPGRSASITKQQLGNADRAAAKGYGYRLLECGFITNPDDVHKFNDQLYAIAVGILDAFGSNSYVPPASDPETSVSDESFGGTYRVNVDVLNVRDAPSLGGQVVAQYVYGQTVVLDDWYINNDGYIWGRYTGASSGLNRYVAVGFPTDGYDPSDYLVKI